MVLSALRKPPLESTDLPSLLQKHALLFALASVKKVCDLHAFSDEPPCLEFGPNEGGA